MEESFNAMYMGFSAIVFVLAMTMLFAMQFGFDGLYASLMEVVDGGYIW